MSKLVKRNFFDYAELTISSLIGLFLLIDQKMIVYLLTLLGVNTIISWFYHGFKKPPIYIYPFVGLFLLYLLGLFFTDNIEFGLKDIETKMSFIVIPLFYGTRNRNVEISLNWILWAFILGAIFFLTDCLWGAYMCYAEEGTRTCYEASRLSQGVHPTYLSLYLVVGSFFLVTQNFQKNSKIILKVLTLIVVLYFFYFVYKLFSLGPWIGFLVMISITSFVWFYYHKKLRLFFLGFFVFISLSIIAVLNLGLLRSDYDSVKLELTEYFENSEEYLKENQNNVSSVTARIILWNAASHFMVSHPFGVGTGDIKDELTLYYKENGMDQYAEKHLNPHSQYLQTAGSIGVVSMLYLIFILFYYTYLGFKRRDYNLIALISLFATANLFESLFERQKGILFFMFFLIILVLRYSQDPPNESKDSF